MTYIITGPTCSGKTTLQRELVKLGFEPVIQYTTRPKRPGEVEDVDYHYISNEEYLEMKRKREFSYFITYATKMGGLSYGTKKSDIFSGGRRVLIAGPQETLWTREHYQSEDLYVVYLDIAEDICADRAINRGDLPQEVHRRLLQDKPIFEELVRKNLVHQRLRSTEDISAWLSMNKAALNATYGLPQ